MLQKHHSEGVIGTGQIDSKSHTNTEQIDPLISSDSKNDTALLGGDQLSQMDSDKLKIQLKQNISLIEKDGTTLEPTHLSCDHFDLGPSQFDPYFNCSICQ